jgi:hypothetical protein
MRDFEPPFGLKFLVDHCEILSWCSGGMESRRFFNIHAVAFSVDE